MGKIQRALARLRSILPVGGPNGHISHPAHNLDREAEALRECLRRPRMVSVLWPEAFYSPAHGVIFRAIDTVAKTHPSEQSIAVFEVIAELRKRADLDRVGGPVAVREVLER